MVRIISKGRIHITDGVKNTSILADGVIPIGWRIGRTIRNTKGKIYITDGVVATTIQPDDEIPAGWYRGKPVKNLKGQEVSLGSDA